MQPGARAQLWARHLGASGIMFAGAGLVAAALLALNAGDPPARQPAHASSVSFDVARVRPPPPPREVKRERPTPRPKRPPRAPLPELSLSLSGIDFGLAEFGAAGIDEASKSLLGGTEALDQLVMTDSAVDVPPRPLVQQKPAYPARARAKGITGQVTLEFVIDRDGRVETPEVAEATPSGVFDDAALEALRRWRFTPATYKGQPVRVRRRLTLRFELA